MSESQEKVLQFVSGNAKGVSPKFQHGIGRCYLSVEEDTKRYSPRAGWNTSGEDFLKALHWITMAAESGDADAQFDLGSMYDHGWRWFVMKNEDKAIFWYNKAAEQEHSEAKNRLAELIAESGDEDDERLSFEIFKREAEGGNAEAQKSIADYYSTMHEEIGEIAKNNEKAVFWYAKAAEQGEFEAMYWLAWHYFDGEGVEKDLEKAKEWAIKADEDHSTSTTRELISKIRAELGEENEDEEYDEDDDDEDDDDGNTSYLTISFDDDDDEGGR